MDVNIGEIASTVRAVDSDALLEPKTLEKIVEIVLIAIKEQEEHRMRVRAEQRITGGVRETVEENWG